MEPVVNLTAVQAWARTAGGIAKQRLHNVTARFKPDHTLVTEVDHEVEAFLADRVRAVYPDHALIGEEGARASGTDYLWAIDPIDGTRAFVQGLPCWGISIGVLYRGQPHWGLFYMPMLEDWTYTDGPDGVFWNQRDLRGTLRAEWDDQSFLALSSSAHYRYEIRVKHTRALGSVAANMVYTARGSALGAFIPTASIWDLAAGTAILARAGAAVRYLSGRAIEWAELVDGRRIKEPILAAHPALFERLQSSIRPKS